MDIERLKKHLTNPRDRVDLRLVLGYSEARVEFYATAEDRQWSSAVIVLAVVGNKARVLRSACVPVLGWKQHAAAYARAFAFVEALGLED